MCYTVPMTLTILIMLLLITIITSGTVWASFWALQSRSRPLRAAAVISFGGAAVLIMVVIVIGYCTNYAAVERILS